ncbi:MAG: ferredoxin-thioredoxin reductase catalytic domain-containing protein [Methanoregulaceae archaeon]
MTDEQPVSEEEILAWARKYADEHGYVLNPDEKQLATVIRGLGRTKTKFGEHYCPCRLRSGNKEKDKAIICPCVYHKDEIEKEGSCHCSLYFRK